MRRVLMLAVAGLLVAPAADAQGPSFRTAGAIVAPNPASKVLFGVSERLGPCGEAHPDLGVVNGVDGFWIQLPSGSAGRSARLEWPMTDAEGEPNEDTLEALDMDAWFYDDICELITPSRDENAYSMATLNIGGDPIEEGVIPADARWVIVNLIVGAEVTFNFTID